MGDNESMGSSGWDEEADVDVWSEKNDKSEWNIEDQEEY